MENGNKKDFYSYNQKELIDIYRAHIKEKGLETMTLTGHTDSKMWLKGNNE